MLLYLMNLIKFILYMAIFTFISTNFEFHREAGGILIVDKFQLPEEVLQLNEKLKHNPQLTENMGPVHLLSVPGRKSGGLRATPVSPLEYDGERWLVAGFGDADWVKNLRASGWGILTKGTRNERITVVEVPTEERAPILQAFMQYVPGGRFAFPVGPNEPLRAFAAIAPNHPIFRVTTATPASSIV
jgi:deazaflavin-dependent oxidoreductase (nitroreductase family)